MKKEHIGLETGGSSYRNYRHSSRNKTFNVEVTKQTRHSRGKTR